MMTAFLLELERNAAVLAFPNSHYRKNIQWIPTTLKLGNYVKRNISDLKGKKHSYYRKEGRENRNYVKKQEITKKVPDVGYFVRYFFWDGNS